MQIIPIFGTHLGVAKLESLDIGKALTHVNTLKTYTKPGHAHNTETIRLLHDSFFISVKHECEKLSKEYINALGHELDRIKITSSWGNELRKGDPVNVHNHPNSFISGVFYLTDGSPLNFHNPLSHEDLFTFRTKVLHDDENPHTWQILKIPINPGYLILFPSKIMHHVEQNENDYRYSVAFNTLPLVEYEHGLGNEMNINTIIQ